jgi:hypothetical protein
VLTSSEIGSHLAGGNRFEAASFPRKRESSSLALCFQGIALWIRLRGGDRARVLRYSATAHAGHRSASYNKNGGSSDPAIARKPGAGSSKLSVSVSTPIEGQRAPAEVGLRWGSRMEEKGYAGQDKELHQG